MAVSAFTFTDPGYLATRKGTIDLENDAIRAVLVDNAHTPSVVNDDIYSDISANECADGDYSSQLITGLTWSEVSSRNFKLDHALINFGDAVTISARYCYFVRDADSNGTLVAGDLIVGYYDLNDGGSANVSSTSSDFDVDANASGCFTETLTP